MSKLEVINLSVLINPVEMRRQISVRFRIAIPQQEDACPESIHKAEIELITTYRKSRFADDGVSQIRPKRTKS